jgi:hypothetical protein
MNLFFNKKFSLLIFISFFFIISMSIFTFSTNYLLADKSYGLNKTIEKIDAFEKQDADPQSFIQTRVGQIVGLVLSFVGILFLLLIIYAGLMWMTSGGNQEQTKKARNLIINATIGLIIVFSAYAITIFIGEQLTKQ